MKPVKALVLGGGGDKGAYEAGGIFHLLGDQGTSYDIFSGCSIGAWNSSYCAMYQAGDERKAADELRECWSTIRKRDVYSDWFPFGIVQFLLPKWTGLKRMALYNSGTLHKLLTQRFNFDPKRVWTANKKLLVCAVAWDGELRHFDERDPHITEGILASSAFPIAFLPIEIDGKWWTDGGLREIIPIAAAIDAGATHIDVIATSPATPKYADLGATPDPLTLGSRYLDIMSDQIALDDIPKTLAINDMVLEGNSRVDGKRHVELRIMQPADFLNHDSLAFDPTNLRDMFDQGYEDAKKVFSSPAP